MSNPYRAPEEFDKGSRFPEVPAWQTALSVVIVIYCSIQYLAITHVLVTQWDVLMLGIEHPFLLALSKVWQAALLFASGILLLLRRRLAIAAFAIYLVAAAISFPILTSAGTGAGFLIVAAITAFAVFLDRSGRLKR